MCPRGSIRKDEKKKGLKGEEREGKRAKRRKGVKKRKEKRNHPQIWKLRRQDSEALQGCPSFSFHESLTLTEH